MQQSKTFNSSKSQKKDIYFTNDHEWIDFQGSVAYMGICSFKLKGIKAIEKIDFAEAGNLFKANDVIGSIYYSEYKIDIHIPVAGRILSFNEALSTGNTDLLLAQPENGGWFALIVPASPHDRKALIMSEQYRMKTRSPW
jgi:glycine cleavage system H protein